MNAPWDLLTYPFMQHAFLAGIPIAALAGLVGYFVVLRSQVFAGDALSHVAFTGAVGAAAFGIDPRLGLFAATIAVALGLGLLGDRGRADDVVIGAVFAWVLGLGVLALSIYTTTRSADGSIGVSVLFGSIFGLTAAAAWTAALIALGLIVLVLAVARPLLFASVDEAVAAARGVPVRALGLVLMVLVGATAAEATQAVGALLLLGLIAAPAGAASRLTDRPYVAMAVSTALAVLSMVAGLVISYVFPSIPPSFAVIAVASGLFALSFLVRPATARGALVRQSTG
jgi:zinc/manganese transport system permease protein